MFRQNGGSSNLQYITSFSPFEGFGERTAIFYAESILI